MTDLRDNLLPLRSKLGRGWQHMDNGDRGKWHFFGYDGRSFCGKYAIFHRNILEAGMHPDEQCAACRRKLAKASATTNGERKCP